MSKFLRNYIREILLTEADARKSNAAAYRDIERTQNLFKFKGGRLTLVDPATRPFTGLSAEDIDKTFVDMIETAGYKVIGTIPPGGAADGKTFSRKYNTYKVVHKSEIDFPEDDLTPFYITFGMQFSAAESIQFSALHEEISKLVGPDKSEPILVWNGAEFVEVDDADRVGGSGAKADVNLLYQGQSVISISLKNLKLGKSSDMQQWSGLSGSKDHPEVKAFSEDVAQAIRSGVGRKFWRPIQDQALREKAVWGPAGGQVDVIVAGTIPMLEVSLDPVGESNSRKYKISVGIGRGGVGGVWYRAAGIIPDGPLEPVLFARPSSDRSTGGVEGQRAGIFPIGLATSSSVTKQI